MAQRRCLVLGSRQALERLNPAVDQALAALDLIRVLPPDLSHAIEGVTDADLILAEVSRPSTAISFELGIAAAKDLPIVYFATADARVSPVFDSVVHYDPDDSVPRLSYRIAKQLELALDPAPESGITQRSAQVDFAGSEATRARSTSGYVVGERFHAMIAHVDPTGGFVLAGPPGRKPAMLHVSRMGKATATLLERGEMHPGNGLIVEVAAVDGRRKQVQLLQVGDELAEIDDRWLMYREARLVRDWAAIEQSAAEAERRGEAPSNEQDAALRVWWNLYKPEIAVIREVRNRVAHGEHVSEAELKTALEYADEVRSQLENPPLRWRTGSPVNDHNAAQQPE
jgi:hypothetical protein